MRILIVDDSRSIRKVIRRILEGLGHEVLEAGDGMQAMLRIESEGPFDVVFLDLEMPVLDGLGTLRELRQRTDVKQPYVICCTTRSDLDSIKDALVLGANDYVMKPFDADILEIKLQSALGH